MKMEERKVSDESIYKEKHFESFYQENTWKKIKENNAKNKSELNYN
jgi:hypothetical protein